LIVRPCPHSAKFCPRTQRARLGFADCDNNNEIIEALALFADKQYMRILLICMLIGVGLPLLASEASAAHMKTVMAVSAPAVRTVRLKPGSFVNLHAKDRSLAGIWVQQYPDNDAEEKMYLGKHPCMVIYVFKDGRFHKTEFRPDGTSSEDSWWKQKAPDLEGMGYWYGSPWKLHGINHERLPSGYKKMPVIQVPQMRRSMDKVLKSRRK
jgi:hypothetical protein